MKSIAFVLLSLILVGFAGSAMAKPDKNDIMHCGCVYVAEDEENGVATMEWKQLSIKNGKGHRNHVIGQLDDCLSGYEPVFCTEDDVLLDPVGCPDTDTIKGYDPQYTTFVRDNDDCLIDGNLNFLELCDDPLIEGTDEVPVEGDECGSVLLD